MLTTLNTQLDAATQALARLEQNKTYVESMAALQQQKQGMLVATPQQILGQFLTDWLEPTHKPSIRPRAYERYEETIPLHIIPFLGKYRLQ